MGLEAGFGAAWSSLSWLSGSLTTFRWLSKKLPVGFLGVYFEEIKKYDFFQKIQNKKTTMKNTKNYKKRKNTTRKNNTRNTKKSHPRKNAKNKNNSTRQKIEKHLKIADETKFCKIFVLLTRRRGCLQFLRPDCLCFYFTTTQKDSKFAQMLLDNTKKRTT